MEEKDLELSVSQLKRLLVIAAGQQRARKALLGQLVAPDVGKQSQNAVRRYQLQLRYDWSAEIHEGRSALGS
ncbi:MAG: hypothetical protein H6707_02875 [Deltaproteobacteria bacterium]|nr:hypothetical protein [Deltaproteobacteria bacterium]